MWWHDVKLGLCYYSCVGSTVSETMMGHERKGKVSVGNGGTLSTRTELFITASPRWFSFISPPPRQSLTSVSYLKHKCNALPPTPPLPLPLSLTEESLRSTREKAPELRGWFYFFPQHEMDLMLALLVPSPQPAATDGKISFVIVIFWGGGERHS